MNQSFRILIKRLLSLPGWHTNCKIVVIESDDWGSIRMPSKTAFERLKGSDLDIFSGGNEVYNRNDALETSLDLALLYEVLNSIKDSCGQFAKMTAVSVVANPDFSKIKENNFNQYFFEPFSETYKKTEGCENSFKLRMEGIEKGIFVSQFHAREHLNVAEWMRALQRKDSYAHLAFEEGFWGYENVKFPGNKLSFQAAFDLHLCEDLEIQAETIRSGLTLFNELFGYEASYFVPTNGPFNNSLEKITSESGIKYMYGSRFQSEPQGGNRTRTVFHYMGQKNSVGQRYLLRNCMFEPSYGNQDWVDSCMSDIDFAFQCNHPAVICSHRVNYIGSINEKNRSKGLSDLSLLLKNIVKRWPDVEFMTSDQLGNLMNKK